MRKAQPVACEGERKGRATAQEVGELVRIELGLNKDLQQGLDRTLL